MACKQLTTLKRSFAPNMLSIPSDGSRSCIILHEKSQRASILLSKTSNIFQRVMHILLLIDIQKPEVDYRDQERQKIVFAEQEIANEKERIRLLRARSSQLEKEEREWKLTKERLVTEEQERQRAAKVSFERRMEERKRLEAESRQLRLHEIAKMEAMAAESLALNKKARQSEMMRIVNEIDERRAEQEFKLKVAKETEAIKKLEFEAKVRVMRMQDERARETEAASLRTEMLAWEKKRALQENILEEEWKIEDEERSLRHNEMVKRDLEEIKMNEAISAKRAFDTKCILSELEEKKNRMAVLRERRLRHVAEDELMRSKERMRDRKAQELIVSKEEEREKRLLAESKSQWQLRNSKIRDQIISREQRRVALEAEMREKRLHELERVQRRRAFEESVLKVQREERAKILDEEKSMQSILLGIEEQRRADRKLEMELLLEQQGSRTDSLREGAARGR